MLTVENINVAYGSVTILWDVSFTLVKTIMGLLRSSEGTIEFLGQHIHNEPTYKIVKDGIALVPEGRELFPNMTVH